MDCKKASILMMMFLDGIVSESDKLRLQNHLEECNYCKQEFSLLLESINIIESIEEIEPPGKIKDTVMSRIDTNKYKEKSKTRLWILWITVIFSMTTGALAYLVFNNAVIVKEILIPLVIKFVNFVTLTLPVLLVKIEENFFVLMGLGLVIISMLLSSIIILVAVQYYVTEKLEIKFRGGFKF